MRSCWRSRVATVLCGRSRRLRRIEGRKRRWEQTRRTLAKRDEGDAMARDQLCDYQITRPRIDYLRSEPIVSSNLYEMIRLASCKVSCGMNDPGYV